MASAGPSNGKVHRRFENSAIVQEVLRTELLGRLAGGPEALVDNIVGQIQQYYERNFGPLPSKGGAAARNKLIVGLSGGIDSTVVLYLAVKAVGRDAVLPITIPTSSHDPCLAASATVRRALGYEERAGEQPFVVNIEPIITAHVNTMSKFGVSSLSLGTPQTQTLEQKLRNGNFASRVRVGILYDVSWATRGRILGSCTRPKYCQGYGVKYGTTFSYDFGVLDELYREDVLSMARVLGVPDETIKSTSTINYYHGQTQEQDLGATTEELDILCFLLFERHLDPQAVTDRYGADEGFSTTVLQRYMMAEHKRLPTAAQEHVIIMATS